MNSETTGLLKMERNEAPAVIKMLARAFWKYPLFTHCFPEEASRQKVSDSLMAMPVYTCLRYGEVYVTSRNLEGAAVWTRSENYPVSFWRMLRSVPWPSFFRLARSGAMQMEGIDRFLNDIHKRLVTHPHFYLEVLGVDPPYQKKGFSSRLIKPMLSRLDDRKQDCYLETQDPQDVPIYQHFGFKIIDHSAIPDTPIFSWALFREPNSASSYKNISPESG